MVDIAHHAAALIVAREAHAASSACRGIASLADERMPKAVPAADHLPRRAGQTAAKVNGTVGTVSSIIPIGFAAVAGFFR